MPYCIISIVFIISTFILNKVGSHAKKCHWYGKKSSILYYWAHSLISHYLTSDRQTRLIHVVNKTVLLYMTVMFYSCLNPYNLKSLKYGNFKAYHLTRYLTKYFQIRSRIITSLFFGFLLCLFIFLLVSGNCPLTLKIGGCWNLL